VRVGRYSLLHLLQLQPAPEFDGARTGSALLLELSLRPLRNAMSVLIARGTFCGPIAGEGYPGGRPGNGTIGQVKGGQSGVGSGRPRMVRSVPGYITAGLVPGYISEVGW
jgi:hypothetical protein